MKNILIRTLGGGNIGYGHFFRCLSLSKAIKRVRKDINIIFLINNDLVDLLKVEECKYIVSNSLKLDEEIIFKIDIDLFVLDTYLADNDYLSMLKEQTKIMLIDDNNDIYNSTLVDIIYNGNIHAKKLNYPYVKNQLRLLGVEYLIMKEEYWNNKKDNINDKSGILITTGGSDEHGIAINVMNSIKNLSMDVRLIIGPGYKEDYIKRIEHEKNENIELIYSPLGLKKYINESKIVITAAGSTIYEVASQGAIPIIFSLADNQDLICKELENRGMFYLAKYPKLDYDKIIKMVKQITENKLNNTDAFNLIDGKGALRVSEILLNNK